MNTIQYGLVISSLMAAPLLGATYYVSNSAGNDSYSAVQAQSQATPWKTVAKVNSQPFIPGDSVLFKRGDAWEGALTVSSSGTSGNPITYGAYGIGSNPVVKGTTAIASAWTNAGGNIFQTDVAQNITQLFVDGKSMTLARYPNSGYLTITDTVNGTTFTCAGLNSTDWTGATVHTRTKHWTIASKKVVACNPAAKSLTLAAAPVYGLKPGWGFFINNSLAALDTAGEWYYDSTAQKLYARMPDGDSPSGHIIEGSTYANGITISGKSWVAVTGFSVFGQASNGIYANNCSNVTVNGNTVAHADAIGIYFNGSGQNNTISGDTVDGSNVYGVLNYSASLTFTGNLVRNIALIRNFTKNGMADQCCSGVAIEINGNGCRIAGNIVDSIGYIGIETGGANSVIENNFIRHCCLSKDDGAGIYTGWQSDSTQTGAAGTVIRENIVLDTRCASDGTPDAGYTPGEGIYIDDYGHDVTVTGNTIAGCANHGIFLHHNRNIIVTGNVSYNNKVQFGFDESSGDAAGYVRGNRAAGNVFYSLADIQPCVANGSVYTPILVTTDSNYYCNPYNDIVIMQNGTGYTLDGWRAAKGLDAHSKISIERFSPYTLLDTSPGPGLIANGTFTGGISGWSYWPSTVRISWDNTGALDAGCMKVLYTDDSAAAACLVYPSSFHLTAGQAYLLNFSVKSNKLGSVQTIVRQAHSPWNVLGLSRSYAVDTLRRECSAVFYATQTDTQSRVDFSNTKADSLYWIDNVRLIPVTASADDPAQKSRLFYNATLQSKNVSLGGARYRDLDGNAVSGSITLDPFASRVLVLNTGTSGSTSRPGAAVTAAGKLSIRQTSRLCMITVWLDAESDVSAFLYDLAGRRVATLEKGRLSRGAHSILWNSRSCSPGNYLLQVDIGAARYLKRITLW